MGVKLLDDVINQPVLFKFFLPNQPISRQFGYDRGTPIDRYYIDRFLKQYEQKIKGDVLEVGETGYTKQFGQNVRQAYALVLNKGNQNNELAADLNLPDSFPENKFDCFICPQTFQYVHDVEVAVKSCLRLLKPGGVFLGSMPAISQRSTLPKDTWSDQWRFSRESLERIFGKIFGDSNIQVTACGNVRVAAAFLYGLALEEISKKILDSHDPDYECLITVYAKKNG